MPDKKTFTPTISITAGDSAEAARKLQALVSISNLIDTDNLETLAKKAAKPGINQKIKQFAAFI